MPGKPTEAQIRGDEPYISRAGKQLSVERVQALARNWGTTFGAGNKGGPGRRNKFSVVTHMRNLLDEPTRKLFDAEMLAKVNMPKGFLSRKVAHALAVTLLKEAIKGDMKAMAMVLDRLYGTVAMRLAGPDGEKLNGAMSQTQINVLMSDPATAEAARLVAVKMAEIEDAEEAALPALGTHDEDDAPQ
jgi:hypothetical protein